MMFTQYNLRLDSDYTALGRCFVTEFCVNLSYKSSPKNLNLALLQIFYVGLLFGKVQIKFRLQ